MLEGAESEKRLVLDLPVDFPFWVGDTVKVSSVVLRSSVGVRADLGVSVDLPFPRRPFRTMTTFIAPVGYDTIDPRQHSNPKIYRLGWSDYNCEATGYYSSFKSDYSFYAHEDDIRIVFRGPIWEFFHGGQFCFRYMGETADCLHLLGKFRSIENPRSRNYAWPLSQALEAIRGDVGDIMWPFEEGLDAPPQEKDGTVFLQKFADRDLGRLFAKAVLLRHGIP